MNAASNLEQRQLELVGGELRSAEDSSPITHHPSRIPLIELKSLGKIYESGGLPVDALKDVNLEIHEGEFVALMGQSGSGKTTLMNILGCLDRPSTGQYLFAGRDVSAFEPDQLALLRRDTFGFVFQRYNLLPNATALENVVIPAVYAGVPHKGRVARGAELLAALGLSERVDYRPTQLSGGQQQRVSIARALMNGGRVILADEPTGALDSKSGAEVMGLLHDLHRKGHTIILITHDANVAAEADRIIQIRDGRIVSDTSVGSSGNREAGRAGDRTSAAPSRSGSCAPRITDHGSRIPIRSAGSIGLFPDFIEASRMALRSLRVNLFRTFLTLLGIIIGVGAVVAMLAIGSGSKREVLSRIEAMGTDLLVIRPGGRNIRTPGDNASLVPDDAVAVEEMPNVLHAVPEYGGGVTVRAGQADYQTSATATSEAYVLARNWPVRRGTFFSRADVESYAPVVVLGATVADNVFGAGADPIGQYLLVNNVPFQIVGVLGAKGATSFGGDMDDAIFVPLTTGQMRLFGRRFVRAITVQVADVERMDQTQQAIETMLTARHRKTDFQIRNMASILETASDTQNTLTLLLGSIAAISLVVGGIGVMNIMLVSVTERVREIGIRMATGARRMNIMLQFNTEALVVCSIGGVLGVVGGLATAWIANLMGQPVEYSVTPVIAAFGSAFFTGLLFGYLPARKASRLDPVVALSTE
jgi:macrolide transport system ATP-binding/permease protein